MVSPGIVVKRFKEDRYTSIFNPNTGFFARIEDKGAEEPFWSSHGPELMDIAITNWCDKGCPFCYRSSDESGTHMSVSNYRDLMEQAKGMHVFQVALGGGNPNQHPDFVEILRLTREDFGIVPNYTTNGRGLTDGVLSASKAYCGAVAVSAYAPFHETAEAVRQLADHGVQVNVHYLLSSRSVGTAINWIKNPPLWLERVYAVVFLNYKPIGRVVSKHLLLNRSPRLEEFFVLATSGSAPFRIGFDTCTITGLARLGRAPAVSIEGCDAGRFSMFLSERMEVYPCSFMVEAGYPGIPLKDTTLLQIWNDADGFRRIRDQHRGPGCSTCQTRSECLSGCPLFPEMNLCPDRCLSE
ncbi:MAG: Coenzyme PQQ synthesis protein E [Fimbriimonadaceae bacterium]|nr:Coenzyme PQQ synthesis protein E [Fimbriimonadaceae bacterium]